MVHRKKNFFIFPSPAGMSLTKLSLGGNTDVTIPPRESLVCGIPAGDGNIEKLFLQCIIQLEVEKSIEPVVCFPHIFERWLIFEHLKLYCCVHRENCTTLTNSYAPIPKFISLFNPTLADTRTESYTDIVVVFLA